MKKLSLVFAVAIVVMASVVAKAQKVALESGNLKMLKGQKTLMIEYDFKDIDMGKEGSETDYLAKKKNDLNAKEPGKGDKFVDDWNTAKTSKYPEKFESLFNKEMEGKLSVASSNTSAKYKLIVKTLTMYPGFNVGITKWPAYCTFEFSIVETAKPDKVLCKIKNEKVPGSQVMGADFYPSQRMQESYAKSAKNLAKYMNDELN